MKALIVFISALLLSSITANAQELKLGFNGSVAIPQYQFEDNINSPGGGLNVSALYGFADSPFGLGLDFSFIHFGTDSPPFASGSTVSESRLRIENEFRINQAMMLATVQQQSGILQAYLEGLAGFNFFFSETTVTDRRLLSSDLNTSQISFKNIAFAWGGGAGVMIRLFDTRHPESWKRSRENLGASYINIGFRYLHGSDAEYLRGGTITVDNDEIMINSLRSGTDLLLFQVGFVFQFQN
ncbi:hypothetical protein BH23BAC3_BH23BAC3_33960 [soil metagenome]